MRGEESSQFLSGLLMVSPYSREDIFIEVTGYLASKPYVDVTLDVMAAFGVEIQNNGYRSFSVRRGKQYLPRKYRIEGMQRPPPIFFPPQRSLREGSRLRTSTRFPSRATRVLSPSWSRWDAKSSGDRTGQRWWEKPFMESRST